VSGFEEQREGRVGKKVDEEGGDSLSLFHFSSQAGTFLSASNAI
jgi:hypothetical protein